MEKREETISTGGKESEEQKMKPIFEKFPVLKELIGNRKVDKWEIREIDEELLKQEGYSSTYSWSWGSSHNYRHFSIIAGEEILRIPYESDWKCGDGSSEENGESYTIQEYMTEKGLKLQDIDYIVEEYQEEDANMDGKRLFSVHVYLSKGEEVE